MFINKNIIMQVNIVLDQQDYDNMHDVIIDALEIKSSSLTNTMIEKYWNDLPKRIQNIAIQHGTSDTVFADEMYTWLLETQAGDA